MCAVPEVILVDCKLNEEEIVASARACRLEVCCSPLVDNNRYLSIETYNGACLCQAENDPEMRDAIKEFLQSLHTASQKVIYYRDILHPEEPDLISLSINEAIERYYPSMSGVNPKIELRE